MGILPMIHGWKPVPRSSYFYRLLHYAENDVPHPQVFVAFGLLNRKPPPIRSVE